MNNWIWKNITFYLKCSENTFAYSVSTQFEGQVGVLKFF